MVNQICVGKSNIYRVKDSLINLFPILKAYFQFLRMDIDIHETRRDIEKEDGKGKLMLHQKGLIGVFQGSTE